MAGLHGKFGILEKPRITRMARMGEAEDAARELTRMNANELRSTVLFRVYSRDSGAKSVCAGRARRSRPTTRSESRLYPCYTCNPWLICFWCEGSDDFFETRVAT
jgi:hypothetical protein